MVRTQERRTGILTPAQLEAEVDTILAVFQAEGWDRLVVSYEGSREEEAGEWSPEETPLQKFLGLDMGYIEKPLPLNDVRDFLRQGTQAGLFTLGETEVSLRCIDYGFGQSFTFVLSEKSEVQLWTGNQRLVSEVEANWAAKGYDYYEVDKHTWHKVSETGRFWVE